MLIGTALSALLWSAAVTGDHMTWAMETVWVMLGLPLIALRWRRFPLTRLLCWLLALHALVLIHGGVNTYAKAPLGTWMQEAFGFQRNP